jgi:hypothetical protein
MQILYTLRCAISLGNNKQTWTLIAHKRNFLLSDSHHINSW